MELLRQGGMEPRVIDTTDFSTGNPLKDISTVMRECQGVIVVAFERTSFDHGLEKRQSQLEKPLQAVRYTTPWSQIEAAIAYALGLPIIVMLERGVREEGLLEEKYDWRIDRLDISADTIHDNMVRGRLMAWCRKLEGEKPLVAGKPPTEIRDRIDAEMKIADLLKMLTIKTAVGLCALLVGIFVIGLIVGESPLGGSVLGLFRK
jgi:hypothetical protein